MAVGELFLSTEAFIRIFVFLLYVPVCVISYWQLIPRPLADLRARGQPNADSAAAGNRAVIGGTPNIEV